ncbi:MAG: hypothetical protein J6C96_07075 [Oscillospiraceae bacterium]|nr:hypothetical protein [Oscillospiraceae bacterium]
MYLKKSAKPLSELQPIDIRILTCLAEDLSVQKAAENLNIKEALIKSRLTAWHASCLHIFRHLA